MFVAVHDAIDQKKRRKMFIGCDVNALIDGTKGIYSEQTNCMEKNNQQGKC
jgi:hypothetical protein